MKKFIVFDIDTKKYAIVSNGIELLENKNCDYDVTSILGHSKDCVAIRYAGDSYLIPKNLKRLKIDESKIHLNNKTDSIFIGDFEVENTTFKIISLINIKKNISYDLKPDKVEDSKKNNFSKTNEMNNTISIKDEETEYSGSDEDKEKIFNEIENIVEDIKIKNLDQKKENQLRNANSYKSKIVKYYLSIFIITIVLFGSYLLYNKSQKKEFANDLSSVSNIESLILKELQKKQELEKKALEDKVGELEKQMQSLQEQKQEFIENQDEILAEKEEELLKEYQTSLEKQKQLLSQNSISKEEYNARVNEINNQYNNAKKEAQKEIEEVKKEYVKEIEKKESEINKQQEEYEKQITSTKQELEKIESEKEQVANKLEATQKEKERLQQKLEELKNSTADEVLAREKLNNYFYKIVTSYFADNILEALVNIKSLKEFLSDSIDGKLISQEEREYFIQISTILENLINKDKLRNANLKNKEDLILEANGFYENKNYEKAYDLYNEAFTNYSVVSELDKDAADRYEECVYYLFDQKADKEIEQESLALYRTIQRDYSRKNYKIALKNIEDYIEKYSNTSNLARVLNIKSKIEEYYYNESKDDEFNKIVDSHQEQAQKYLRWAQNAFSNGEYEKALGFIEIIASKYNYAGDVLKEAFKLVKNITVKLQEKASEAKEDETVIVDKPKSVQVLEDNKITIGRVDSAFSSGIIRIGIDSQFLHRIEKNKEYKVYREKDGGYQYVGKILITSVNESKNYALGRAVDNADITTGCVIRIEE